MNTSPAIPGTDFRDHDGERHLSTVVVLLATGGIGLVLLGLGQGAGLSGGLSLGAGLVSGLLALALHRRVPGARIAACVLAVLALPVVPVGTAFGLYLLRVLATDRGRRLFRERAPAPARPYGAIFAAHLSLAGCVAGALVVLVDVAWPMLARAHREAALTVEPPTREHAP